MCDLETFQLHLKMLKEGENRFKYSLDDVFFEAIDAPEVKSGKLDVELSAHRNADFFELNFHTKGWVNIPCDLCLDDMKQPIDTANRLLVKFGEAYSEDDEQVVVEENNPFLDLSWFIYEFIVLNIPIKHVHAPSKCNPEMIDMLHTHMATQGAGDNDQQAVDPRWMKLKEIKNNIKD